MINTSTLLFYGQLIIIGIVAYLLGSVNSSIIVGKFYKTIKELDSHPL